jgi:alpha-tubulin suppressor-like RCC1 family protein
MMDHSGNIGLRTSFATRLTWLGLAAILVALLGTAPSVQASPRVRQEGLTSRDGRVQFAIDAGELHTCAVRNDGTMRCWGYNADGQLGDGTQTDRPTPITVSGLTTAVTVSAGIFHTCAVLVGGTARCWGDNSSGQLGDNSTTRRRTPVNVASLTNAIAISAGGFHTCALLADGTVRCWGENGNGQLGDGTTAPTGRSAAGVSTTKGNWGMAPRRLG